MSIDKIPMRIARLQAVAIPQDILALKSTHNRKEGLALRSQPQVLDTATIVSLESEAETKLAPQGTRSGGAGGVDESNRVAERLSTGDAVPVI